MRSPPGSEATYAEWKCLNRLRSRVGRARATLAKWGYINEAEVMCKCGAISQTMPHLLECPLSKHPCTVSDLAELNENAKHCVQLWVNQV